MTRQPADPPGYQPGNSRQPLGRLASTVERHEVEYFFEPLIPRGCLTFVVGDPGCGKSTFGAFLCAGAECPAILPGFEEDASRAVVPRLVANRVAIERTLLLDQAPWTFPADRGALTSTLQVYRCDLLWVDPVDSYFGDASENEGQAVRACLESLARLARDVGCAVVCARHPGKLPGNVMPGSRQWRAVPRVVLELLHYPGPPERRILRANKDSFGRGIRPRCFELVGADGEPKRWQFTEFIEQQEVELAAVADRVERWKVSQGVELLLGLLAEGRQEASYCYAVADREKIDPRTLRRAAERIGIVSEREGTGKEHKAWWTLPGGGVGVADVQSGQSAEIADSGHSGHVTPTHPPPAPRKAPSKGRAKRKRKGQ